MIKNRCQQIKINKNWQKSTKHKKCKNTKIKKTQKVTKTEKQKSDKMIKMRKWKSDKKVSKIDPPWKRPKCQINGHFWHFAKSEPPGWALFRFQGVPRDPVLRPKIDMGVADGEFLHVFNISSFCDLPFYAFSWFCKCVELTILSMCSILCYVVQCIIRSYGNYRREYDDNCGGSPLIMVAWQWFC